MNKKILKYSWIKLCLNQTINFGQDRKLILIKYIVLTVTQQIKHAD